MQKFVFSFIFTLLLLELNHGLGVVDEEMKGLEEDQITMFRKIRNVRNVELKADNEGSGEEATDKSAMERRREVNNKDGSSSSEDATEGSGEEQPTVKQTGSPMPTENENNQATRTEEATTPEELSTTKEATTPEEPSTTEESTTPEEPSTTEESTITPEEPSTTEESTTRLEDQNSTVPEITTTPYVATTQIIILDGKEWILYEGGNITSRNGTPLVFPNVEVCNDYIRTDAWLNGSKDDLSIICNEDLSTIKQSYGKWWGIGLAFIISTCVTCCCCYFCIGLDCYLQYRR